MSWNWLGWLSWICAIAFFCYVIHYIRVKQLMLIAKTKKEFKLNLVIRCVILLVSRYVGSGGCHISHFSARLILIIINKHRLQSLTVHFKWGISPMISIMF